MSHRQDFTHSSRRPISHPFCAHPFHPLLHSLYVVFLSLLFLYMFLSLSLHLFTLNSFQKVQLTASNYIVPGYQPIPYSSICQSLDHLPYHFFSKNSTVFLGLRPPLRMNFLTAALLILSGDINLNPGPAISSLNLSHLNIRSASSITLTLNKPIALQEFITDHKIDILPLSETWLSPDSLPSTLNSLTPSDFSLIHSPRPHGTGGGLAVIYRSCLNVKKISLPVFSSFESLCIQLTIASSSFTILSIYRPPALSKSTFSSEFSTLLEDLVSSPSSELLITGDFNFHVDQPSDSSVSQFLSLLDTFSLTHTTHPLSHTFLLSHIRSDNHPVRL